MIERLAASVDSPVVFGALMCVQILAIAILVVMIWKEDAMIEVENKVISVVKHNFKARRLAHCRKVLTKYNYIMNKERR